MTEDSLKIQNKNKLAHIISLLDCNKHKNENKTNQKSNDEINDIKRYSIKNNGIVPSIPDFNKNMFSKGNFQLENNTEVSKWSNINKDRKGIQENTLKAYYTVTKSSHSLGRNNISNLPISGEIEGSNVVEKNGQNKR